MTLPFRRRHHDHDGPHDRARSLASDRYLEPLRAADEAWLEAHLAACRECRGALDAIERDHLGLQRLRDHPIDPPRDLWARTAAAIEGAPNRRPRARAAIPARFGRLPIGVLSGVLVVLVVVATSLMPKAVIPQTSISAEPPTTPPTIAPASTPLPVTASLTWLQRLNDGSYEFVRANVAQVCTDSPDACAPLDDASSTHLTLNGAPQAVVLSPGSDQLVVVSAPGEDSGGDVLILPVPTPAPSPLPTILRSGPPSATPPPSPTSSPAPTAPASTAPATPIPTPSARPTATPLAPSPTPGTTPSGSASPAPSSSPIPSSSPAVSPSPEPGGGHAILSGVIVVGDAAYSADGTWLAFSARPIDGSVGPDLYVWHAGDEFATAVSTDHRTFFAGWLGNLVLASRIEPAVTDSIEEPGPSVSTGATPVGSGSPAAPGGGTSKVNASPAPTSTPRPRPSSRPARTPAPTASASPTAGSGVDADPSGSPDASSAPIEGHPESFLLDPATGTETSLGTDDIWHPVVDPTHGLVAYWSGTLVPDPTGTSWTLGTGRLVLDRWLDPAEVVAGAEGTDPSAAPAPGQAGTPGPTPDPTPTSTLAPGDTPDPEGSPVPPSGPGPAGAPVVLADGPVADFEASFDPTGTRLAIWLQDPANHDVGTLRLLVLDPGEEAIVTPIEPLPGVASLRGFSIGASHLAWVTPQGQNGDASHVHVLAWSGDDFGQVRSLGADRFLVVR